ncbi:hypothetical protein BJ912DRAFT_936010 [Pholiota molesta]|nr:hypothetical protein BJ912DRAFT_936010 [Pholiota molesta]
MSSKPQAHWSAADTSELLDYLWSQRATLGDGSSFKAHVWTEAAKRVNAVQSNKGVEKNDKSCKNKWARLKDIFHIVEKIKAQSGFKWDDERGADIDESTAEVWEAYEKKNKDSHPFRNKGWIWWSKVEPLMPSAPRGANIFCPSQASQDSQVFRDEHGEELDENGSQAGMNEERDGMDAPESQGTLFHWSSTPPPTIPHNQLIIDDDDIIPDSNSFDNLPPATPVISQQAPTSKRKHSASSTNSQPTSKGLSSWRLLLESRRPYNLMDLFQNDVTMADAYLSIKRHGVRKAWVNQHLPHIPEPAVEADDEADGIYA